MAPCSTGSTRSPRTRDTLHRLVEQGIKFVVATYRHHVDVRSIRDTLGLDIYLITSNGAVVHDKQDQLIFNQALPDSVAAELIALERDPPSISTSTTATSGWWKRRCPGCCSSIMNPASAIA